MENGEQELYIEPESEDSDELQSEKGPAGSTSLMSFMDLTNSDEDPRWQKLKKEIEEFYGEI